MPIIKDWAGNPKQGTLIGNLESLREYNSLLVCEGFFDAYRCNVEFELPSIALLGSVIGETKRKILKKFKSLGYKLVYIPDIDKKGSEIKLLKDPIWDKVLNFTKYVNPELSIYKHEWIDIDDFFILHKKNNLNPTLNPKYWKL